MEYGMVRTDTINKRDFEVKKRYYEKKDGSLFCLLCSIGGNEKQESPDDKRDSRSGISQKKNPG
jgi:hypothetical protein